MNDAELDHCLKRYRRLRQPPEVPHLAPDVWREIRHRQQKHGMLFNFDVFLSWFQPRQAALTFSALLVTTFLSLGFTLADRQPSESFHMQQALGLHVFSREASPLTHLASR